VTLAAEYRQWVEALDWATGGWSGEELRKLYFGNAKRIYKLAD
jgi:hypothetical protein